MAPNLSPLGIRRREPAAWFAVLYLCVFAGCIAGETDPTESPTLTPQEECTASDSISAPIEAVVGQTVYVPVYSHIYHQDGTREYNLTATLSI